MPASDLTPQQLLDEARNLEALASSIGGRRGADLVATAAAMRAQAHADSRR